MDKEDIEYVKHTLEFALAEGTFTDQNTEHLYSAVCNSINVLDQLALTGVVQPSAEVCDCGKKILKQTHFYFNNRYYCVCGRVIVN